MNLKRKNDKGLSLMELFFCSAILLSLAAAGARMFDEAVFKGKTFQARMDVELLSAALVLYESSEARPYQSYNYFSEENPNGFYNWSTADIVEHNATWATCGGATEAWSDFSGTSLSSLIGSYLNAVPRDPWNRPYIINTAAGYVASASADGKASGPGDAFGITEDGRGRDIVRYYLDEPLVLKEIVVYDMNQNGRLDRGVDYFDMIFNKDVVVGSNASVASYIEVGATDAGPFAALDGSSVPAAGVIGATIRVKNNGRILRIAIAEDAGAGDFLSKWFRIKCVSLPAKASEPISEFFFDMDPYCRVDLGLSKNTHRPVRSSHNQPKKPRMSMI